MVCVSASTVRQIVREQFEQSESETQTDRIMGLERLLPKYCRVMKNYYRNSPSNNETLLSTCTIV